MPYAWRRLEFILKAVRVKVAQCLPGMFPHDRRFSGGSECDIRTSLHNQRVNFYSSVREDPFQA